MSYVTGKVIRELREKKKLTQKELADHIAVSDKTVSKWETGKGLPDIGILDELALALGISVSDLLTGEYRENDNQVANMRKSHFYVCPVCGNVIFSIGAGSYTCCGIKLPELEAESVIELVADGQMNHSHKISLEEMDGEYYVHMNHEMTKQHYISWIAYVTTDSVEIKKLYPEQDICTRFKKKGHGMIYAYCNRHGMMGEMTTKLIVRE